MSRPFGSVDIESVLDDVVEQFADPYAFLREHVQNAIDAGTGSVEVRTEFEPLGGGAGGRATIHVRDWGEGMDREIIEERLLRLFRSGKEEDYTKIGRFGIGFVSVFAIDPDVVCVDTGRSGEYWRVLFDEEPSYELLELDRPLEGTHIRVFKDVTRDEYEQMQQRSREALREWCRHAEVPVRFDGEDVRDAFDVDAECTVEYSEPGTRIVAGYVGDRRAPYGFYNRGLKLEEGRGSRWPHVAFKVDSRYLDHTVARDGVVEDGSYHKAIERLEEVVRRQLPQKLIDELERLAEAVTEGRSEVAATYDDLASRLAERLGAVGNLDVYGSPLQGWRDRAVIPTRGDEPVSVAESERAHDDGKLFVGGASVSPEQFESEVILVPTGEPGRGAAELLRAVLGEAPTDLREEYLQLERTDGGHSGAAEALCMELELLFRDASAAPRSVACAEVNRRAPVRRNMALVVDNSEELLRYDDLPPPDLEHIEGRHVWLNVAHDAVGRALAVAREEPAWAAYNLAKTLTAGAVGPEQDLVWVKRLIERRGEGGG